MARKLFLFVMVSADGYFERLDHDLSWHNVDSEFQAFSMEQLSQIDTILFGRKTFQMMASYWTTAEAKAADPATAIAMNELPKIVASSVSFDPKWSNTAVVLRENVRAEIQRLKALPGKDLALFGSNELCVSLMKMGLVDELRIMVNPVVLGSGRPLFCGLKQPIQLQLVSTRKFQSGNVLNHYSV